MLRVGGVGSCVTSLTECVGGVTLCVAHCWHGRWQLRNLFDGACWQCPQLCNLVEGYCVVYAACE